MKTTQSAGGDLPGRFFPMEPPSRRDIDPVLHKLIRSLTKAFVVLMALWVIHQSNKRERETYRTLRDAQQIDAIIRTDDEWRIKLVKAGLADYNPGDDWRWRLLTVDEITQRRMEGGAP